MSPDPDPEPKKKRGRVRKLTGKALAAARRNIKKAQAALRRRKPSRGPSTKRTAATRRTRRGGVTMAKARRGRRRGRRAHVKKAPGVVAWARGWATLVIGLSGIFSRLAEAARDGSWLTFAQGVTQDFTGAEFSGPDWAYNGWKFQNLARGYAPILGGIAFHKGTGLLQRHTGRLTLMPALRA